jgi:hypothetical protein
MISERWKQFIGSGCIDLDDLPWEVVTCGTKTKCSEDTGRVIEFVRVKLLKPPAPLVTSDADRGGRAALG